MIVTDLVYLSPKQACKYLDAGWLSRGLWRSYECAWEGMHSIDQAKVYSLCIHGEHIVIDFFCNIIRILKFIVHAEEDNLRVIL